MAAPASMSKFLIQPARDFLASAQDEGLTERLAAVFTAAGITDVCSITRTTRAHLALHGAAGEDIDRLQAHLAFYDVNMQRDPRALGLA